jgi:hypothetical protein
MMIRLDRSPFRACLASLACTLLLGGCGRSIRALDTSDQLVSNRHRTAEVQAGECEIAATWSPVPWAGSAGPIGFWLQIANGGEQAVVVDLQYIHLEDGRGRRYAVLPPDKMLRAFSTMTADRGGTARLVSHGHVVRRTVCRTHYWPHYRACYAHGWGWYDWGPYDYDPYYEQRRTSRFLAQLLESQLLEPQAVAAGYVVFPYAPAKDETLTLTIAVFPETAAQPAEEPVAALIFEVR